MPSPELPPELWERIQTLFETMVEAVNPLDVLAREPDPAVRVAAESLYRNHGRASSERFLDEPVTLVRSLAAAGAPQFRAGQLLAARFAVERLLGAGGMGEVYLAHDNRLQERVAIKTIRAGLAAEPAIRRRFFAEIQNSRRVTHPNVCRIFDLFEEGETPFFSMEYLEGTGLAEWLDGGPHPPALSRRIALQLAEGLDAAHRNGIVHCDFKPANVILTGSGESRPVITDFGLARALTDGYGGNAHSILAGTFDYMAPEVRAGGLPSVRSDIYAFGKVLSQLLPTHRLASACAAVAVEDRPVSLQSVIRDLRGGSSRRYWMMAAAAAPFAGLAGYELLTRPHIPLLSRQRIAFNGFRPAQFGDASLLRDLVMVAVRQSLLVTIVPDDRVRSLLRRANLPEDLPADTGRLLAAMGEDGIGLVIDGTVRSAKSGLSFVLEVFQPGDRRPSLELSRQVTDRKRIVSLAESVALELRREFGESRSTLSPANATPLAEITSSDPNALDCYFQGVRLYENDGAEAAIEWFQKATELDDQFALAFVFLGLARNARFQRLTARPAYERAFALRGRISQRERLWVEFQYYNFIADTYAATETARRLAALYPEDATYQRNVAFAYAYIGRPEDALPYSERAVQLDPNDNNVCEWIINSAEANRNDEALEIYRKFKSQGYGNTLLDGRSGSAWLGKGEFDKAREAFAQMGSNAKRERWARLLQCAPGILTGRFAETAATLESDLSWDIATGDENHSHSRRVWLGNLEWLMDAPSRARYQVQELLALPAEAPVIDALREAGLLASAIGEPDLAGQALRKLTEIADKWPSTHTRGIRANVAGVLLGHREEAGALLNEAVGLWRDPYALYAQAEWLSGRDNELALAAYEELHRQRGRILALKRYFPGLLVLGWIGQARCLVRLSRFSDSLRIYEQVRRYWLQGHARFALLRQVQTEMEELRSSTRRERK